MENKSLTQAQVATVLATLFVYLFGAYQIIYYTLYFWVLRDFNGLTIIGPAVILALKFLYGKNILKMLKTPDSVTLSSMSVLFAITLIYEAVVAVATGTLFHYTFTCSGSLACGALAFLFLAEVIEFVLFSGLTLSLWPYLKEVRATRSDEALSAF